MIQRLPTPPPAFVLYGQRSNLTPAMRYPLQEVYMQIDEIGFFFILFLCGKCALTATACFV